MKQFKVIALSCNSKKGVLSSGEIVSEDAFEDEQTAAELVRDGFLEEVSVPGGMVPKAGGNVQRAKADKKKDSIGNKLVEALTN